MKRACIFDVDGTLIDSMGIWDDLGKRFLAKRGIEAQDNLGEILFPMSTEQSASYLRTHYGVHESIEEIRQGYRKIILSFYRDEVQEKPGACAFVKDLHEKKIPLCAVTTNETDIVHMVFQRLGIDSCFLDVLACSDLHTDKTKPDIYLSACKEMKAEVSETLVFEDTLQPVKTAVQAGFFTVAIEDEASRKDQETIRKTADLFIHDWKDPRLLQLI
jgi:HAD superfamily hydrolase (TIGR01509 family)